jgi:hypothetical protein
MIDFRPEEKLIIATVVEDWLDRFDRSLCGTPQMYDLVESLYMQLEERFKEL